MTRFRKDRSPCIRGRQQRHRSFSIRLRLEPCTKVPCRKPRSISVDLHVVWFILLGVLLAGYAVLDGFDLGVGILHLLGRTDRDRRLFINAIGPIWDGNEVWLITFGGALFAAFPPAYATVFSGFYLAMIALLFALIFRAVSIEFRSKMQSATWRRMWDYGFFAASLLASLIFGIAV